jgi:hypothetical protein
MKKNNKRNPPVGGSFLLSSYIARLIIDFKYQLIWRIMVAVGPIPPRLRRVSAPDIVFLGGLIEITVVILGQIGGQRFFQTVLNLYRFGLSDRLAGRLDPAGVVFGRLI